MRCLFMLGSYDIKIVPGKLPEKVAAAFDKIFKPMVGASYTPIAYLGSKVVTGTNYAILAKQTLVTANPVDNIVLIVLNEKPGSTGEDGSVTIAEMETVLSNGGNLGGLKIEPTIDIPADALSVFTANYKGFFGNKVKPFALLATQVVNGIRYVFAAETNMVVSPQRIHAGNTSKVVLVSVMSNYEGMEFNTIIEGKPSTEEGKLGYAFTWLW